MRFRISVLLCFCSFMGFSQLESPNYLLNLNGMYSNNGETSGTTFSTRLGGITAYKLAVGVEFSYTKARISDLYKVYQIEVGPFARYYIMQENLGFFIGGEASYASLTEEFETQLWNEPILANGTAFLYGPNVGVNFFVNEYVSFEVMYAHLWQSALKTANNSSTIDGISRIEVGFSFFL